MNPTQPLAQKTDGAIRNASKKVRYAYLRDLTDRLDFSSDRLIVGARFDNKNHRIQFETATSPIDHRYYNPASISAVLGLPATERIVGVRLDGSKRRIQIRTETVR